MDLFLYIALSVLTLVMTFVGVYMSLNPPATAKERQFYYIVFGSLCVLSLAAIVWTGLRQKAAGDRAEATQNQLQNQLKETKDSVDKSKEDAKLDAVRMQEGIKSVQVLLLASGTSNQKATEMALEILKRLQAPFTDNGNTLSTNRSISTTGVIQTIGPGQAAIDLTEEVSGRKLTWQVGFNAPQGSCVTGSIYARSNGERGSTLYICEKEAWVAK